MPSGRDDLPGYSLIQYTLDFGWDTDFRESRNDTCDESYLQGDEIFGIFLWEIIDAYECQHLMKF